MELFDTLKNFLTTGSKPGAASFGATPTEDPYKFAKIRNSLPENGNNALQQIAAPLEHREFVEGFVKDNPVIGPPAAAVATLGYYAKKKLTPEGLRPIGETPASLDQVFAGLDGIIRGVKSNLTNVRGPGAVPETRTILAGDPNARGTLI